MESKKWPQDVRLRLPQAIPGPLHVMHRLDSDEGNESKVGPKARTLAALDASDSDPGPNRMHRIGPKWGPRSGLLDALDAVDYDPGPNRMHLMHPKPGPKART